MQIQVFHNVTKDAHGRHVGMLDGYRAGHDLALVYEYTVPDDKSARFLLDGRTYAEDAFHLFNVGDDPAYGTPDPRAVEYRAKRLRSLSVGDVVVVGERAYACAALGWDPIAGPPARAQA